MTLYELEDLLLQGYTIFECCEKHNNTDFSIDLKKEDKYYIYFPKSKRLYCLRK